jgi:putative PEP-CTERM system histidine kinase
MQSLSQWSYALAAALFGAVALWQARRDFRTAGARALVGALIITAFAAFVAAIVPVSQTYASASLGDIALVQLRHLGWLGFLYLLWRRGGQDGRTVTVGVLYGIVAALFLLLSIIPALLGPDLFSHQEFQAIALATSLLHILAIVGGLVLIHNLYTAGTSDARDTLRLPLLGISAMWIYDLNLYTFAYLSRSWPVDLFALQGLALALTTPLFGLSVLQNRSLTLRLSRSMAFQSVSLFAIGAYLIAMVAVTAALDLFGGEAGRIAQIAFVFAGSLAALMLGPSTLFRAWFRVKVSKHLFQHRYDYRSEWLRFTTTLGKPGDEASALSVRVIQAIADIVESPSGLLLTPDANGALLTQSRWNWIAADPPATGASVRLGKHMLETSRVIECDALREAAEAGRDNLEASLVPEWVLAETQVWAMVPLVHFDRLAGVIVLARPIVSRTLDWEDFDLLKVAGRQVASYLAEASSQEALSDAQRFDEFNRRFAFIMHDIKNLVSQLSLLTRNAERHADNPEFRADMIETLKSSTARMNALLARLSQHNKGKREELRLGALGPIAQRVAATKTSQHPVVVGGNPDLRAVADPVRLEQALSHLVQNAIDASDANEPVTIRVRVAGEEIAIDVIDKGLGMSAAFINTELFKPFASTKDGGFGIGAFEARSLINEMRGRIQVTSREGHGSIFSILLPAKLAESNSHLSLEALAA